MINETALTNINIEQFQLLAYQNIAIPSMIIFFAIASLVSLIVGLLMTTSKLKYFKIWITSFTFIAVILLLISLISSFPLGIIDFFSKIFG